MLGTSMITLMPRSFPQFVHGHQTIIKTTTGIVYACTSCSGSPHNAMHLSSSRAGGNVLRTVF